MNSMDIDLIRSHLDDIESRKIMKPTLSDIAAAVRVILPGAGFVTLDSKCLKVMDATQKPQFVGRMWTGKALATFFVHWRDISLVGLGSLSDGRCNPDFSRCCVQVVSPNKNGNVGNEPVIVYHEDGSTEWFESIEACRDRFNIPKTTNIRRHIKDETMIPGCRIYIDFAT